MRILVTGGAGFIGSHLCEALLKRGDEVVCLDNFVTGSKENISGLLSHKQFQLITHDVEDKFPAMGTINTVYHLAAIASPWKYLKQKIVTLNTNVMGTRNALEFCHTNQASFILASTSEVYGDPEIHPQKETYWGRVNPIGPRSCYDEGKRVAEAYTSAFHDERGLNVGIVRIFNTYGPRMTEDDGRPIINFSIRAMRGEAIKVFGTGLQTRSFCYVDDLVRGLLLMGEKGLNQGPINIGNPDERSILSIAQNIKEKINPQAPIQYTEAVIDDPQRRKPDISKALALLGWKPEIPFEEGFTRTFEWVQMRYSVK